MQIYKIFLEFNLNISNLMTDPIFYLSMLLGLGGVYVLISSFHDDDDGDDDGEKYIYNLEQNNLARQLMIF